MNSKQLYEELPYMRKYSKRNANLHVPPYLKHCTEVRFASFLSGGFTTMAVINPLENKLAKRISVHCFMGQYIELVIILPYSVAMTLPHLRCIVWRGSGS